MYKTGIPGLKLNVKHQSSSQLITSISSTKQQNCKQNSMKIWLSYKLAADLEQ